MKRSNQLAPPSRKHHAALEVAMRLRRATAADAAAVRHRFLKFFQNEAREQFRAEEEHVLPAFARHVRPDDSEASGSGFASKRRPADRRAGATYFPRMSGR